MNSKTLITLLFLILLALSACSSAQEQTQTIVPVAQAEAKISAESCPESTPETHSLIFAAQGVCFLYPNAYDARVADDKGSLQLYVGSLLNTEAPIFSLNVEPVKDRSLEGVVAERVKDFTPSGARPEAVMLGGEPAYLLDNLPGQDTNRRIIAIHNERIYDLFVARIGSEYGEVGVQAEELYNLITSSFQFIGVEPEAPVLAGPVCPDAIMGTILYTSADDGFCLLLPEGYAVDDSLTTEHGGSQTAVYIDTPLDTTHARLFVTVSDANGLTLEQVTAAFKKEIEAAVPGVDLHGSFGQMLDGEFANQFEGVPGQDFSRKVIVLHNGELYTLTFIPDDPAAGQAYSEMQVLYDTVMDSFSFIDRH